MKMKKMLAILAALSVLGTTGLTVGAEDTATTTEPATEAITTTETEAETTAAETTAEAETETTVETAATEENQVVKMEDASDEITLGGVSFTVKVSVASDSSVVLSVLKDGNVTNLNNICVESKVSGELQVSNYYSVSELSGLVIYAVDGKHTYTWVAGSTNMFSSCSNQEKGEDEGTSIKDTSTFQINGKTVKVVLYSIEKDKENVMRLSVYVDGKLTNLSGIVVNTAYQGIQGDGPFTDDAIYRYSVHQYFSVSGNVLTINPNSAYGKTASYTFDDASGQFVTAGTASTTTTTTAAETTTTTTTTTTSEADLEAAEKALYEIYAAKYKPAYGIKEDVEYHIVDGVLTSATIVVDDEKENLVKTYFVTKDGVTLINSVPRGGMGYGFESTDFTCDGYQFYAQFVQPGSDGDVRSYLTIYVYDENGNLSVTNINGLTVGTCLYGQLEDGSLDWLGNYKIKLSDCLSWNGDTITINRNIAKYNDSSLTHGVVTSDSTTYTYDAATNTFVATNGTNNGSNDGKTDNGSASNAPATKNTSGTPKTGDTTTVPAVAVGLTLTAAGVVAFISKRKK